jgi:hypothetical protein
MELFAVFSWCLLIVAAATIVFPINIAALALAAKLRQGHQAIPMETSTFWLRSTAAAFGLFLLTGVTLVAAYAAIEGAEMPAGPVHLALILAYVPLAVWLLYLLFALEDGLQALSVFVLDAVVAGLPILLFIRITGWWQSLGELAPWIMSHS